MNKGGNSKSKYFMNQEGKARIISVSPTSQTIVLHTILR